MEKTRKMYVRPCVEILETDTDNSLLHGSWKQQGGTESSPSTTYSEGIHATRNDADTYGDVTDLTEQ